MRRALQLSIVVAIVSALARFVAIPAYAAWAMPRPVAVESEFVFETFTPEVVRHSFHVVNRGRTPTTVSKVATDCGCTMLERNLAGTTLKPGEEIEIPVALELSSEDKEFDRSVYLRFSDGDPSELSLTIRGAVRPFWNITPREVMLSPTHLVQRFDISPVRDAPFVRPSRVSTNHPDVTAQLLETNDSSAWAVEATFTG